MRTVKRRYARGLERNLMKDIEEAYYQKNLTSIDEIVDFFRSDYQYRRQKLQTLARHVRQLLPRVIDHKETVTNVKVKHSDSVASTSTSTNSSDGGGSNEQGGNKYGPRFSDLGGMDDVLDLLLNKVIIPFCHPELTQSLGLEPISGLLIYGPPGCGKTTVAHAIATESGCTFYSISSTELVSGITGASEENIRELYSKAYRTAPAIVFIDEIDTIASKRDNLQKEAERRVVSQLMTCMDESHRVLQQSAKNVNSEGADCTPVRVLTIGATNRPDAVDAALRRPGRFDREICVGVPNEDARIKILSVVTSKLNLEGDVDLLKIARSTPGFVGADLIALVKEAGSLAMESIINRRKFNCCRGSNNPDWWKPRFTPAEVGNLSITMANLEEAAKIVQASTKREGFSSILDVKWEDFGDVDSLREQFKSRLIDRIKYPDLYKEFGVHSAPGFLLYGPPGCGKTSIAMAVANEAGANFIYIKGPELLTKYVGDSELAVRTIFSRARMCPPCIIFFDEVDALTTVRGSEGGRVVTSILTQLLTELCGGDRRDGVYVIGATNRLELIDPAILRPGRLGKLFYVPLPSPDARVSILQALAKKVSIDSTVGLAFIGKSESCNNFSGADLNALMEEAAYLAIQEAIQEKLEKVQPLDDTNYKIKASHFKYALEKVRPSVSDEQNQFYEQQYRFYERQYRFA